MPDFYDGFWERRAEIQRLGLPRDASDDTLKSAQTSEAWRKQRAIQFGLWSEATPLKPLPTWDQIRDAIREQAEGEAAC